MLQQQGTYVWILT